MPDLHYDEPALAELYDIDNGWSEDRDFYLGLAGEAPQTVLDLGCGTGLLSSRYAAAGHVVTGADPSPAMLDVARKQPHGGEIHWVLAGAEHFRGDRRFDLIIMTGHAFQVLETDAAIAVTLSTMRDHLAPGGHAVFESRNPAIDWVNRWHGSSTTYEHKGVPIRQSTEVVGRDGEFITFHQHFAFPDRTLTSTSRLRFAPRATIERLIEDSGLRIDALYGDWHEGPFDPVISDEMVFVLGRI